MSPSNTYRYKSGLPTQQIYQHSTQTEQKKDKYEEKNFMRTGLEYYIFPNVCKAQRG
mgnify:CR=1 FL=1